jgi:hypothetical protein
MLGDNPSSPLAIFALLFGLSTRLEVLRGENLAALMRESLDAREGSEDDRKRRLRSPTEPFVNAGASDGRSELLERSALDEAVL